MFLRRALSGGLALLAAGCAESSSSDVSSASSGGTGASDAGIDVAEGTGCACVDGLHTSRIFVLSQEAEIWSFDPATNAFEKLAALGCAAGPGYSMAVDWAGRAWVLFLESQDIAVVDVAKGGDCADPGYQPGQSGFGVFGMAFSGTGEECPGLYVHTYDGAGPFSEGPDLGRLGVIDAETAKLTPIGSIDFDGGELAGTGDGRLFAFAGNDPAKLVEYDESNAGPIAIVPLDGFYKTTASAFAFFAGDIYFFTEAQPATCAPCLTAGCGAAHAACLADPACADELACALAQGDVTDACGGGLPVDVLACVQGCWGECMPDSTLKISQVTRLDHDGNEGGGMTLEVAEAPIRIVGAGTSTCVPTTPR